MSSHISNLAHFVWSTSERRDWIRPNWSEELYAMIGGILNNRNARLIAAGGMADHIHVYASLPSTLCIADAANVMKSNSSRWVHNEKTEMFAWQTGYGAFTVSWSNEDRVIAYVQNQEEHHRRRDFKTELLDLLQKHEIKYDERYLWG